MSTGKVNWAEIADYALGTSDSEAAIAERFDIDEDVVLEGLLDFNIERCEGCGWFVESGDLTDDDSNPVGICRGCRDDDENE